MIAWVPALVWYVTDTYQAVILTAANAPYLYSLKVYFVSIIASCTHFKRLACYFSLKVGSFSI